jgi:hypothetical protein
MQNAQVFAETFKFCTDALFKVRKTSAISAQKRTPATGAGVDIAYLIVSVSVAWAIGNIAASVAVAIVALAGLFADIADDGTTNAADRRAHGCTTHVTTDQATDDGT